LDFLKAVTIEMCNRVCKRSNVVCGAGPFEFCAPNGRVGGSFSSATIEQGRGFFEHSAVECENCASEPNSVVLGRGFGGFHECGCEFVLRIGRVIESPKLAQDCRWVWNGVPILAEEIANLRRSTLDSIDARESLSRVESELPRLVA